MLTSPDTHSLTPDPIRGPEALPIFFVNAFADGFYHGNTAAVVILEAYPPDSALLRLAAEFGFSETAFLLRLGPAEYQLRWFTPEVEVPLCGHATLASAMSLFSSLEADSATLSFHSLSGELSARRRGELIELDFPLERMTPATVDPSLLRAIGPTLPQEVLSARDSRNLVLVYSDPAVIHSLNPDFTRLKAMSGLPWLGIAVTAPEAGRDYICRYFAPWEGINEDPVTGSAQTYLAPWWAQRLGKNILQGAQVSQRGGAFEVEVLDARVLIRGRAFIYLKGALAVDVAQHSNAAKT